MDQVGHNMLLSDRLAQCYSGAVYDVLRSMGYLNQTLPHTIRPLQIDQKIAGEVFTIEGRRVENVSAHETLLKWCELLSRAPSDAVVICQPNDEQLAHMGELSSETLMFKKVRGYIVDGGCRDTAFIARIKFPVFCKYFTPVDVVSKWVPTAFAAPILIGEVSIHSGDYVIADNDGIVVIPGSVVKEVVERTEAVISTENLVRKAILNGVDPVEAYVKYGKF